MTYKSGIALENTLILFELIHETRNGIEYFLSNDTNYRKRYSLLDVEKNLIDINKTIENLSSLYSGAFPEKSIEKAKSYSQKTIECIDGIFGLYKERPALYNFIALIKWDRRQNSAFRTLMGLVNYLEGAIKVALKDIAKFTTSEIPVNVSTQTSSRIDYQQIRKSPQSAIQLAFTIFEENLRTKLGVGAEIYGEELINQSFGKNGRIIFSSISNEQMGFRNLVSGFYATFRNSRMHRLFNDDENASLATVLFVDFLLQIVNQAEKIDEDHSPSNQQ